jgi:cytochrome c
MDPSVTLPVPRDIPLPLPLDRFVLEVAVVILFLAHILFVNFMVGGSTLSLVYEILGLRRQKYDALARLWAETITVNKSLAVVLGVAPLLVVNVLYTIPFYTANALTGSAWIMVIPLVAIAFLLGYLHKYTWDVLSESKGLHIAIGAMATAIFWFVPLIFLANINLMLFPERWTDVHGFLSAVALQNVLPRYLHFLLASLAVTGLFGAAWFGRSEFDLAGRLPGFDRPTILRRCYSLAFGATLMQFLAGTLVYFTLPAQGISFFMTAVILLGVTFAVAALTLLWREVVAPAARIGRLFVPIVLVLAATVSCMAMGRHLYRAESVAGHSQLMQQATEELRYAARDAAWRAERGIAAVQLPRGQQAFGVCAGCHALDRERSAPSVREIQRLYADNPAGIVAWAKSPGRKRASFAPMPPFGHLPEADLRAAAEFMLEMGREAAEESDQSDQSDLSDPSDLSDLSAP